MIKSKRGITLIALVVTIIVLLLLAGVSISMLTGQNGILNRAGEAKEKTDIAQKEELAKLEGLEAVTNVSGYVDSKTKVKIPAGYTVSQTNGENTLGDGLVIKDVDGNEFVWIEVPKTLYSDTDYNQDTTVEPAVDKTPGSATDYKNIEFCLRKYAEPYVFGSQSQQDWIRTDSWYDFYGTTYDETNDYSQIKYSVSESNFDEIKTYYGQIYTNTALTVEANSYVSGTTYYVKANEQLKKHTDGCGMTYEEYNQTKKKMLTSIYNNGGFWISRYEMGDEEGTKNNTVRANATDPLTKAVCKINQIPYVYITCSQAETLAKTLSQNSMTTSSLPFGVQWSLVCKYLEEKNELIQDDINKDSKSWGNYINSTIKLDRGKYLPYSNIDINGWIEYKQDTPGNKENGRFTSGREPILITTGASEETKKLNIYDFAGNTFEWTLEHTYNALSPCARRGGDYTSSGDSASSCVYDYTTSSSVSYRVPSCTLLVVTKG